MKIKKRDGRFEQLSFDKIMYRLKKIKNDATLPNKENATGKLSSIDTDLVAQKVILSIYDGVSSSELDEEAARIAISMTENPEYARLASRIIISNLHKNTTECFSDIMERLYTNLDKNDNPAPILADDIITFIRENKDALNEIIDYKRDYLFDYFGFKTLEKSYLMKINGKIVERPQHLYMRVAVQVHKNDIENVIKTYNLISQHYFTFASPTLFNAGSRLGNLSSCFLIGSHDSIEGIFKTMSDVAKISKVGGGIGIHINNIRSKGSVIRGTNGISDGIIPMLKVYNSISTYVNQCFTPNTTVYSRDGIKRMDQVTTEDYLVTLDGSFKKVNEVIISQKSEEILEIAVACGISPVCCTKVHDIYALRSKSRTGKDRLLEQLRSGVKKPSFMPAEKLSSNDYVAFPIPTFEQDLDTWTLERCKLYGTSLLNCDTVDKEVLHLPKSKLTVVLAAMMDRCVKKQGGLLFSSESLNVIQSMKYMLLRMGILTSPGKKGNTSVLKIPKVQALKDLGIFTRFEIPKPPKFKKATAPKTPNVINFFQFENILYCRIKSINKKMYTGDVYDFNMIDNHNYLTDMGLVHNSGKRKGSFAIYLSPEHPDILEFLDLRKNQGSEDLRARDLFYAMWMPDLFMEQVEKDGDWYLMDPDECPGLADTYGEEYAKLYWKYVDEKKFKRQIKAQDIWMRILESQIETGNPYIVYKDQANLKSNQKNIGTIKSSNLCVAPETQILTSKGYFPIGSLRDQPVEVWNGQEFSETTVRKTGENQELIKVKFSNGSKLECTKYHKFFVVTGKRPSEYPRIIKVEAKDLEKGMKLIKCDFPIIEEGLSDFPYPYEHGLFSADGTLEQKKETIFQCNYKSLPSECYCGYHIKMYEQNEGNTPTVYCQGIVGKGNPRITLYGEKKKLVKYISSRLEVLPEKEGKITCRLPMELKPKYEVPINYNIDIKLRWLEGLSDGDGSICKSGKLIGIQISSIDKQFLENVKYLLQTLGCDPKICLMHKECDRLLPKNDGSNEYKEYKCQACYRILITSWDVATLYSLGFRPKRLDITGVYPKNNTRRWIQIEDIIHTNRISDTFCFTESKRNMGIFNGIISSQCAEVLLYSDNEEYAVCNLMSVALPKFVKYDERKKPYFDHQLLFDVTKHCILPMNNIIDYNFYPVPETRKSNFAHRPIGLGAQGLSCLFIKMRIPFESEEARKLNREIFETYYFAALTGSMELAKRDGAYSTFKGSPMSEGKFQFDLWSEYNGIDLKNYLSGRWDWDTLRKDVMQFGIRNSTLTTCMPTASSAQIMGNTESIEPFDSCIFKRRVLSGEYVVCNKYLVDDLLKLDLWNKEMKDTIIANNGSIQNIDSIPDDIKALYKTVWEMSMKNLIDLSAERSPFICMTQSLNLFMSSPTIKKLSSMHFYGWKQGLKTGIYYLRSKSQASAGKFSIDANLEKKVKGKGKKAEPTQEEILACSIENREACDLCSS
jgi:ribonucleoside-diphosphate reductase alpha chain